MLTRGIVRLATVAAGALLAVAVTAGCGGRSTIAAGPGTTSETTTTTSATNSPATTSPTSVALSPPTTRPPDTQECVAATLKLSLRFDGVAAGSTYQDLAFTNSGTASCLIVGFPGVSYVTGDDGRQVGAAAARVGPKGAAIVLAPGQSAYSTVQQANSGNYDPATCRPTPVRGLRVYAPDDRAAKYVAFSSATTACASTTLPVAQLRVQTVMPHPSAG
jgi:hypothetical protein